MPKKPRGKKSRSARKNVKRGGRPRRGKRSKAGLVRDKTFAQTVKDQYGLGPPPMQLGFGKMVSRQDRRYKCLRRHGNFLKYLASCSNEQCGRLVEKFKPEIYSLIKHISDDTGNLKFNLSDVNAARSKLKKHEKLMESLKRCKNPETFFLRKTKSNRKQMGGFIGT